MMNPDVIPAKAGIFGLSGTRHNMETPAFAGVTINA